MQSSMFIQTGSEAWTYLSDKKFRTYHIVGAWFIPGLLWTTFVSAAYPLLSLVLLPFVAVLIALVAPNYAFLASISVCMTMIADGLMLLRAFDPTQWGYQLAESYPLLPQIGVDLALAIDGLSRVFILLNIALIPVCLFASLHSIKSNAHYYYALFMAMGACVNLVFLTTNLFVFYLAFEIVLIPMYLIIGYWGSRERKIRAAYFFFLFTLRGSVALLVAIIYLIIETGTSDMNLLSLVLVEHGLPSWVENLIWLGFFVSFAVKVPMVPLHIWLPEAHVEAPTGGSVYLAGILLKLGTYGLLRLSIPLFPAATMYFSPRVVMLCRVAIVYASLTAIRQTDMKRIIAYASVAHMNITRLGIFSMDSVGFAGGVLQMISHGIVAGALFLCVGVLYDRYHSRLVSYYGGVAHFMPLYAAMFLLFTMANIAIPGTSSFIGEFMIFLGVWSWTTVGTFFSTSGLVLGGAYSLWLLNRVIYGNVKSANREWYPDLNTVEKGTLFPLALLTVFFGVYPEPILVRRQAPTDLIISKVRYSYAV